MSHLVLVKNIEDKVGEFAWISKGKELLVDLCETLGNKGKQ